MRRPILFWVLVWSGCIGFISCANQVSALTLQSGESVDMSIPGLTFYSDIYIDVTATDTLLTVTITNGSGNLDLYMKYGSKLSGKTVSELKADADIVSDGPGSDETLVISPSSSPALKEGRWYIAPLSMNTNETDFTLTAILKAGNTGTSKGTAHLEFSTNDNYVVPWGHVRLSYRIKSFFNPGTRADLYIAVQFQNSGGYVFINENYGLQTTPVPFVANIQWTDGEATFFEGDMGGGLAPELIKVYGVLTETSSYVFDTSKWLSNVAEMSIVFNHLSGEQWQLLAERGNPHFMSIRFDHENHLREETWIYPPLQFFEFINGSLQESPDQMVPASASSGKGEPIQCEEILFRPTTTPEEIHNLFGDPDQVLEGSTPDTKIWFFSRAGIRMTVKNGKIQRVEVY